MSYTLTKLKQWITSLHQSLEACMGLFMLAAGHGTHFITTHSLCNAQCTVSSAKCERQAGLKYNIIRVYLRATIYRYIRPFRLEYIGANYSAHSQSRFCWLSNISSLLLKPIFYCCDWSESASCVITGRTTTMITEGAWCGLFVSFSNISDPDLLIFVQPSITKKTKSLSCGALTGCQFYLSKQCRDPLLKWALYLSTLPYKWAFQRSLYLPCEI